MDEEHTHEEAPATTPANGNAQDIQCCFMVVIGREGGSTVVLDPQQRFNAARLATPQDVYGALANCMADWQSMKTAEAVVSFQQQVNNRLAQQAQVEAIQQRIQHPGGGLFPPR